MKSRLGEQRKTLVVALCAIVLSGGVWATIGGATPFVGLAPTDIGRGTVDRPMTIDYPGLARIEARRKLDVVEASAAIIPFGHTGWHSHSGPTVLKIRLGTAEIYDARCRRTILRAGHASFEPKGAHILRNRGAVPLLIDVFEMLPVGADTLALKDEPAPNRCFPLG